MELIAEMMIQDLVTVGLALGVIWTSVYHLSIHYGWLGHEKREGK